MLLCHSQTLLLYISIVKTSEIIVLYITLMPLLLHLYCRCNHYCIVPGNSIVPAPPQLRTTLQNSPGDITDWRVRNKPAQLPTEHTSQSDISSKVKENDDRAKVKMKTYADSKMRARTSTIKIGDVVLDENNSFWPLTISICTYKWNYGDSML